MIQKASPLSPLLSLKTILWLLSVFSLASSFSPELRDRLALSLPGIEAGEFWRLLSYPASLFDPSFSLLLSLAFTLYLTWLFGAILLQKMGPLPLTLLYFGSTLVAGGAALATLFSLSSPAPFASSLPPLLSLLFTWSLLYPEEQLLLFGLLKAKGRWVIGGVVALLSALAWASHAPPLLAAYSASLLFSYLFFLFSTRKESYLSPLRPLERALFSLLRRLDGGRRFASSPKIYDIRSGKPLAPPEKKRR